jgi:hypothetical protein
MVNIKFLNTHRQMTWSAEPFYVNLLQPTIIQPAKLRPLPWQLRSMFSLTVKQRLVQRVQNMSIRLLGTKFINAISCFEPGTKETNKNSI